MRSSRFNRLSHREWLYYRGLQHANLGETAPIICRKLYIDCISLDAKMKFNVTINIMKNGHLRLHIV